ncbi:TetR/AcrR family transcriptional regulator [Paenibacillus hemerocallicola]|uniref:TetR/AcrR family transcriptional regulator n=1 Tax=Paenibacillus hemerocallicola TaxID=1172614 RepID=A0A5C4TDB0_9BACL|nr:TetR/AcrR family transcriptional regulator [Paenibacillus hemerocallicola]TNJ66991.1 TetR/AcrR family transcriptional regulator [Paenibacillus hemerocallicola]
MSPLSEEQLIKRRETQRQRIVEAALKVFAVRGLHGAKMSMIAEEAELSAGQLYRFFESKEELFITLIRQVAKETTMERINDLPGSPFDKLRSFTASILKEESAQYPFKLIQHANNAEDVPDEAKQLLQHFSVKRYIEQLLPLFEEGQQIGDFAQGNARKLISAFLTMLSALITLNMPIDDDHQLPDADMLMRIVAGPRFQDR